MNHEAAKIRLIMELRRQGGRAAINATAAVPATVNQTTLGLFRITTFLSTRADFLRYRGGVLAKPTYSNLDRVATEFRLVRSGRVVSPDADDVGLGDAHRPCRRDLGHNTLTGDGGW